MVVDAALGRYILAKRVVAKLSLRDVADSIGASHVFLSELERGVRGACKLERLDQLEKAIPGFSAAEARRVAAGDVAPPEVHFEDLGAAIVRRLERRKDIRPAEMLTLRRILLGADD